MVTRQRILMGLFVMAAFWGWIDLSPALGQNQAGDPNQPAAPEMTAAVSPADPGAAPSSSADLTDMSLTELMEMTIVVPGSLTEDDPAKTPASVTIITAEDIARTPARNILDLMEIYVPGALYVNHSVGPVPGIRGIIADRPYKFLVNVNGMNVNIKSHYGARLELLNWDMNDIDRIEIIRGPGSVRYGPGAIGGVINIYTKTAKSAPGLQLGGQFVNKYNSIGQFGSVGHQSEMADVYGYLSVVSTDGVRADLFGVNSSAAGYVGHDGPSPTSRPFDYLADFDGQPQIKAHADVRLKNNWRLWARYNSFEADMAQGSSVQYRVNGEWENFRQTLHRYWQLALEKQTKLDDAFSLTYQTGFSSIDSRHVNRYYSSIQNSRDNLQNIAWIWSENEFYNSFMLHYDPESWVKICLGAEGGYNIIGPAWGKNSDNGIRMADGIISGPGSDAYGTGSNQINNTSSAYFPVGNGWESFNHAFLGEVNMDMTDRLTSVLSARMDKHTYTDYMFSPRSAWIYELAQDHYLKFIAQRSVRQNSEEELYMNDKTGQANDPEILDTLEAIYTGRYAKFWQVQTSGFIYRDEVIAWDFAQRRSANVGELKAAGLEVEARYQRDSYDLGVNHSFVKQLDFELDKDVLVSGISYSDYYQNAGNNVIIMSNGNDLNNWSNHATKFFGNIAFLDGMFSWHSDMQVWWGFEGNQDGLDALDDAGGNQAFIDAVRDHDAYEMEIRANTSLTYHLNKHASVSLFLQSIPVMGDNKRYSYSSGYKLAYPDKSAWVEEPMVVGMQYRLTF